MYNKMLGKLHERNCDCNCIYVSGTGEKCNKKNGNTRRRVREKRFWKKDQQL